MRKSTLRHLECPHCADDLDCRESASDALSAHSEILEGQVFCKGCGRIFPILAGVLLLVPDVGGYIIDHVKGIARHVQSEEVPQAFRASFEEAKNDIVLEHIEEDLEAERVNALYFMTHYLRAGQIRSESQALQMMINQFWDHGPFERIQSLLGTSQKRSFIELGCGVGGLAATLSESLHSYLGLDSSFSSILLARHLLLGGPYRQKLLVPDDLLKGTVSREVALESVALSMADVDFIVCDLDAPPVKKNRWEMTAALNVIDMLAQPEALPRLQQELLVKGGLAIQSSPYIWHEGVAGDLRAMLSMNGKKAEDSAAAIEWLYQRSGFEIETSERHVPWLFFKNNRQLELYSVHLFSARKQ